MRPAAAAGWRVLTVLLVDPLDTEPPTGPFYVAAVQTGLPPVLVAGPVPTHAEAVDLIDRALSLPTSRPTHFTTAALLPNPLGSVLPLPLGKFNPHFGLES